jgi:hypothetical protein
LDTPLRQLSSNGYLLTYDDREEAGTKEGILSYHMNDVSKGRGREGEGNKG